MNMRNLCSRIISSMLAPGIVGSLVGLGAHSVSAQSITVTTPLPYCVNNHEYPRGTYRFTLVSEWLLSIRNMNGGGESLFLVHPEVDREQGLTTGGLTFRTFQGFRELKAVHEPGSDLNLELVEREAERDKSETHGSLQPINCFNQKSSIRGRNTTGQ